MTNFNARGENIKVLKHLHQIQAGVHEVTQGNYAHFMTLTPAYVSTLDDDFIRASSHFIICMNEHLYTKRYGPRGNGRWLRGWGFFERQYERAMFDKLIEGATGRPRIKPKAAADAPLHVHLILEELQLDELGRVEQQRSLREAALHAIDKSWRNKKNGSYGSKKQHRDFIKAWDADGGSSPQTRQRAKAALQVRQFNMQGLDIRPIYNQSSLIDYCSKQVKLFNCQMSNFDFMVPIEPNGFPHAIH